MTVPHLLFRAFADPTRLRILHLLRRGESCVGDLVTVLGVPQAKVSRHLGTLARTGLVRQRESGRWRFYAAASPASPLHRRLMNGLTDVQESARDARRAAALRRRGGCCP